MADTFTPSNGYLASVTFNAEPINIRGEVRVSANRNVIDISCIGDGIVPFRSFSLGMYDQAQFTVPVPYDQSNDAVADILAASISGTPTALIIKDAVAGNTLLSGNALCSCEYASSMDDIQLLNVTFTFTGALTGDLVA